MVADWQVAKKLGASCQQARGTRLFNGKLQQQANPKAVSEPCVAYVPSKPSVVLLLRIGLPTG